jgi:hypothetical protein
MEITVTIDKKGNSTVLAMNTLEDLRHDFQYFLKEAKTHPAVKPETMFLHKRFLRAALLILFAYAEGVTNRWLFAMLEQRKEGANFEKLQFASLDKKVALLSGLEPVATKPNLETAKKVRNLLVHFKPGRDGEAFDSVTLPLVEEAAETIEEWMEEMESSLGLPRFPDTDEIMEKFAEIGTTIKETSSKPDK